MLVLVAALLLLGIALGAVAQLPVPVSLAAGAVIGCWLLIFAARERHAPHPLTRTRTRRACRTRTDPKELAP